MNGGQYWKCLFIISIIYFLDILSSQQLFSAGEKGTNWRFLILIDFCHFIQVFGL